MTESLKLELRVAPESKLTYRVLKYTSSKISDLISRKTLVGESKKLFALRCIWDEKSMKAMIGTNSKQLSGCLVFTRLHSQQNHFPDHAKLPRPAYISTIFIVFKERLISFKRKKFFQKIAADHVASSRQRGWLRSHRRPLMPLSARAPGWKMGGL